MSGTRVISTMSSVSRDLSGAGPGRRCERRQQLLPREELQRPRNLWRARRAEGRPQRRLDDPSDLPVPEAVGRRRRSSWTRTRLDLDTVRFRPEIAKDKFWQAALTIQGKIANFDMTYAGAYMDRKRSRTAITPITPTPITNITSTIITTISTITVSPRPSAPAPAFSGATTIPTITATSSIRGSISVARITSRR